MLAMARLEQGRAPQRGNAAGLFSEAISTMSYNTPKNRQLKRHRDDFRRINEEAVRLLPMVLARLLPGGQTVGNDYVVRNPKRADEHAGSFRIAIHGAKAGVWRDFAVGVGGSDPISLVAYLESVRQGEAAVLLANMVGLSGGGRYAR